SASTPITLEQRVSIRQNWLGTDANGGDVLARILYGTRISVLFGLMLTLCSSVMGVLAGALQGYYGGKVDLWGQRFIEVWSGMPTLFLIILLSSVVQPCSAPASTPITLEQRVSIRPNRTEI
ncbi:hypothetical protein ACUODF_44690, partial [Escherichia coli]